MGLTIFLVLLGVFFLVAELVFLPGVTLGAILAVASYGAAIYFAFAQWTPSRKLLLFPPQIP